MVTLDLTTGPSVYGDRATPPVGVLREEADCEFGVNAAPATFRLGLQAGKYAPKARLRPIFGPKTDDRASVVIRGQAPIQKLRLGHWPALL